MTESLAVRKDEGMSEPSFRQTSSEALGFFVV